MISISKVNLKYKIISDEEKKEEKLSGIFNNGRIVYKEDTNTKMTIDLKKESLERENNDILIKYDFSNEEATIYLKDLNKTLTPKLEVKSKEITDNSMNIMFYIEDNIISYYVEVIK